MRSMLAATLIFVASGASAQAQMTAPSAPGPKPKPVATVPIRPALQSPADTANAMAQAERQAIQSDLAWVGEYNGALSGEVNEPNATTAKLAEQEKKEPPGRKVEYAVVKPDFFVLSGMQGLRKFYVRGQYRGSEIRILTILYDQATEGTVEPVVIAMSSAFNPFPSGAQISGPPPRKTVEYGTGIVVSDDAAIIADREVADGCLAIALAGYGHADRVAEDKDYGLALLRIHGARAQ